MVSKTYLTKPFFLLLVFIFLCESNSYSLENKILFKIENKIITSIDIYNEINYLKIMNKDIGNLDEEKIYQIAKNSLIREKIKEFEILKKTEKIDSKNQFLNDVIINYYSKLGISSIKQFENFFNNQNLRIETIRHKIAIQTYWNNLIYSLYSSKVKINKSDIKKKIIKDSKIKTKSFSLSEIVFEVRNKEVKHKKFSIINESIAQNGFENTALLYSITDSSKIGGKLGWVNENSINSKIRDILGVLEVNQYSDPIKIPSGFLILKINEIKEIESKIDIDKELKKIIKKKTNEQLSNYSNIYFNKIKRSTQIENL